MLLWLFRVRHSANISCIGSYYDLNKKFLLSHRLFFLEFIKFDSKIKLWENKLLENPLVSIALPVFNAEKTLAIAIRSIIYQTYSNWELFVIDDGSTDNSLLIAQSFKDSRIVVISDGKNKGISSRLNQALTLCKGEYFARMDADDVSFPERIEYQVKYMSLNRNIDLLGTGIIIFSGDGISHGITPVDETIPSGLQPSLPQSKNPPLVTSQKY